MPEQQTDYKIQYEVSEKLREERQVSDSKYAIKLVERIVFGIVTIFALAALYFIFLKIGLPSP